MFRCQLSNEFGPGHLSGEEVPHRAVVITEKQRAFEQILSCESIDRNYPAKALQPTFDIIEQESIVYLELR